MTDGAGQSIRRNVSVIAASRIITTSSSIVLMLVVPRTLGDVDYGRYYLAQSLLMLFMLLVDFGVGASLPKAVARHRTDAGGIVSNALGARLIMAAGAYLALIGFSLGAGYPAATVWVIVVLGLSIFVNAIASVFNGLFQGFELMQVPSTAGVVGTVVIVGGGIATVLLGGGVLGFSAAVLVGTAVIPTYLVVRMTRVLDRIPRPRFREMFGTLRGDLPYFLNTVFGMVYYRIDTVMLSLMTTEAVVGWYGAAYRFFDSLTFIPYLLTTALFPVMSRLWGTDSDRFAHTLQRTIVLVLLAGVPVSLVTFFQARVIVDLFFGLKSFAPTAVLLQVLSVGMLLVYVDSIVGSALMSADRQRELSMVSLSAVFVNVGLNLYGIPFAAEQWGNGGIGSAVATGLTEVYVMAWMFYLLPSGTVAWSMAVRVGKVLAVGLLAGLVLAGTEWLGAPWFAAIAVAMAAYAVLTVTMRVPLSEDYDLVAGVPVVGPWVLKIIPVRYRAAVEGAPA